MKTSSLRAVAAAALLALVALVAGASPAAAHAELTGTEPASGARLEDPPRRVRLMFTERVSVRPGGVRLFDSSGRRLETSAPRGRGSAVETPLPELGRGSYVLTWRVVSADSHPIQGAFTFRVGDVDAEGTANLARRLLSSQDGSPATGFLFALVRIALFASLIVLAGAALFAALVDVRTGSSVRHRSLLLAVVGAGAGATIAGLLLQGAYAAGLPIRSAVDPGVVSDVLATGYGRAAVVRLGLLVVLVPLLWRSTSAAAARRWAVAVVALGALATVALGGHAATGNSPGLAVLTDVVHLGAGALWIGGLVILLAGVLRPDRDPAEAATVAARFSRAAALSVAVIVATGLVQGWRQIGSWDALDTTYGRIFLLKVGVVVVLVMLGAASRSRLHRRLLPSASPAGIAALRRSVWSEVGVAVAVLAVTAVLVNAQPAKAALAEPFDATVKAGPVDLEILLMPAKAGPIELHVHVLRDGELADIEGLTARFRQPSRDIGPLDVRLERDTLGHYAAYGLELPISGQWVLDLQARTSDVDQHAASTRVRIR